VKIYDFGLWFQSIDGRWSTIPRRSESRIYYDGSSLGFQYSNFDLAIYKDMRHLIQLRNQFCSWGRHSTFKQIGRLLTLDDFEIIENPDYLGD
jgi:hypothetical protein